MIQDMLKMIVRSLVIFISEQLFQSSSSFEHYTNSLCLENNLKTFRPKYSLHPVLDLHFYADGMTARSVGTRTEEVEATF